MRFETRFDPWLVGILVLSAAITCVALPAQGFFGLGSHPGPQWFTFIPLMIWLIVVPCTLPQYYEVREDGLFVRQGWRKILIPHPSLVQIESMSDWASAAVYSTHRLLVTRQNGAPVLIAVAQEERFLTEVSKRCPQLERRAFGLALKPVSSGQL